MAIAGPTAHETAPGRDHRFHPLRIGRVVRETEEASSFVLEVPAELEGAFTYRGASSARSAPASTGRPSSAPTRCPPPRCRRRLRSDGEAGAGRCGLQLDGRLAGSRRRGRVDLPGGRLLPRHRGRAVVAFAAGSGITPVYSIVKTALRPPPARYACSTPTATASGHLRRGAHPAGRGASRAPAGPPPSRPREGLRGRELPGGSPATTRSTRSTSSAGRSRSWRSSSVR